MKKLSLIVAVLLAGCGGGGGVSLPPPEVQRDLFFVLVSGVVSASPDDTEPTDVASMAPTTPEGTDPETL